MKKYILRISVSLEISEYDRMRIQQQTLQIKYNVQNRQRTIFLYKNVCPKWLYILS